MPLSDLLIHRYAQINIRKIITGDHQTTDGRPYLIIILLSTQQAGKDYQSNQSHEALASQGTDDSGNATDHIRHKLSSSKRHINRNAKSNKAYSYIS